MYNWLCTAHTLADILGNVARIRATQLDSHAAVLVSRRPKHEPIKRTVRADDNVPAQVITRAAPQANQPGPVIISQPPVAVEPLHIHREDIMFTVPLKGLVPEYTSQRLEASTLSSHRLEAVNSQSPLTNVLEAPSPNNEQSLPEKSVGTLSEPSQMRKLQSSKVPSSRIGRLFHYGGQKDVHFLSHVLTF
jgi:aarF domain-containing kinase